MSVLHAVSGMADGPSLVLQAVLLNDHRARSQSTLSEDSLLLKRNPRHTKS